MSNGRFSDAKYGGDVAGVHRIRVQPETRQLVINSETNEEVAGEIDSDFSARVSGSRRGYGLFARTVTVRFDEGVAPAGYEPEGAITLPWLNPTTFANLRAGNAGTYLGVAVKLVSKRAQVAR